ncbi:MAG: hypothetical protein A2315_02495 [Ignavibacteria bacterium RIFOXYB2_FULL_35_12]|nr:MAG: hypothetical protein A2058_06520 [Ignavibacteria bacterium GWA2_36_19]OGU58440.1 MAG: hypothetical protein A2X60_08305 [Ignavibacteria bacterium GWF2_35_20]OGU77933.1 MAG: hypothetical protein A2W11_12705 [Ignavibacteria bacterium RBG_16_35_7]OGU88299.1 MAG: hypothetical protein A2492_08385 [Ignavibacteria bacterium RIFOXYC12_FULL_35_11]OGU91632.1 MAG: hypothetical protein A3K31_02990 [Ignavibacteria bacterium RIFOXYA12_FULL_35_25]OGU97826.1 MAG: hypothetical protein A2347_16290 [Ignav
MTNQPKFFFSFFFSLFLITALFVNAQQFRTPRPSPSATLTQTVGVTDITIDYSSPGVKERKIWGDLVPYDKVWRTGANEVTSITFSDLVKINGNNLAAGTYGIHTIPREKEWDMIFSSDTKVNDPSDFDEKKEALRIKVKPVESAFSERLIFTFSDMTDNSAMVNLIWEKIKVSFKVETETQTLTLSNARKMVDWGTPFQAAQYCLINNVNLDEAVKWIEASTLLNENYWNMRIKARLLEKLGRKNEAVSIMERAIEIGNRMKDKPFDFEQMQKMLSDWK